MHVCNYYNRGNTYQILSLFKCPLSELRIHEYFVLEVALPFRCTFDMICRYDYTQHTRARRVKVRFSLRAIILSLENLNVIIRAIN